MKKNLSTRNDDERYHSFSEVLIREFGFFTEKWDLSQIFQNGTLCSDRPAEFSFDM